MIVVFGSINVDIVFPVTALPVAGETVLGDGYRLLPGGKGANQALAAARYGAAVSLAGAVGADAFAEAALALLREEGVDLDLVRTVGRPTGCAAVLVAGATGENLIAVASGANADAREDRVPDALLRPESIVVAQMEVPVPETLCLLERARRRGARCMLNLAPFVALDDAALGRADLLVVNAGEMSSLGVAPATLAARLGNVVVATRGGEGAAAFRADGTSERVAALPIVPRDTTGAGDVFAGVLAAALAEGRPLREALRRASAAAGLACGSPGAQPGMPRRDAIEAAVRSLPG